MCDMYTSQKVKHIHKTDPASRQRGCYISTMITRVMLKNISGRDPQRTWRQDELIGGKPSVVK
jgi:hypothetical protein